MLINNNYSYNQSFNGIKVKDGGIELLKKEGSRALLLVEQAKDECAKYKWHININPENYTLTSPSTKKTYTGPFSVKRHVKKNKNKPDEFTIIVRMNDGNRENYTVSYDSMEEVQSVYKSVKNSMGIEKMVKLLHILERGFKLKALRHKLANMTKFESSDLQA